MADLAQQLQLSSSTVSRALAGHPEVRLATRARVQQLAQALDYQPNGVAASLRRGRSQTLGLVVPHLNGYFFPAVIAGIERVASAAGYSVVLCQSNADVCRERHHVAALAAAQVAGIMLSAAATSRAEAVHLEQARQQGRPLVFFDRVPDLPHNTSVMLDDFRGAYLAVQHLIEQGCRRIAHLAGPQQLARNRDRCLGYQRALLDHGLPAPPSWLHPLDAPTLEAGRRGMQALLQCSWRPDAVFAADAYPAAGALEVAQAQGLRVPHDVALACFSNEPFTSLTQVGLTTVDERAEQMGEAAARLLLQALRGDCPSLPTHLMLQPELRVRPSSLRGTLGALAAA